MSFAIVEYLARVQPFISRMVHVDLNQRTTKVLIDKSKMAVDSSFSFLIRRKHHTNPKLRLLLKIENKKISMGKIALLKLLTIDQLR